MCLRRMVRAALRHVVRRVGYGVVALIGAVGRLLEARSPHCGHGSPHSILLVRLDLLGDLLFSMPAAIAIRRQYPDARIVLLTLPYTAPLARLYSEIDEVIEVDTNRIRTVRGLLNPRTWAEYRRVVRRLRAERFDLAICVNGRMASLWTWLSGAIRRVGYAGDSYPFMLSDSVPGRRYAERKHEVEYVEHLARHAGAADSPGRLAVSAPHDSRVELDCLLERHGVGRADRIVVVHAGTVNGSAKRWPSANWARFADALQRERGVRVVLAGAGSDCAIANEVLRLMSTPAISLVGETDVPLLLALLERADLVATGDSGPLHMTVALGRPLLAVYGPTDPAIYGPFRPIGAAEVLRADLPCSPCYTAAATAECPLGDPICMRLVTVDHMLERARRILRGESAQA